MTSPKNTRANANKTKRKLDQIDSQTSPTTQNPAKIPNKTNNMPDDATKQILDMLNKLADQNVNTKKDLMESIQKTNETTLALKQQITDSHNSLKAELIQLVDNMKSDFKADIEAINKKMDSTSGMLSTKVKNVDESMATLHSRVNFMEKDFERLGHLNELKLIGIPVAENEQLTETFTKIAGIIGYDFTNTVNIPVMTRMMSKNRTIGEFVPAPVSSYSHEIHCNTHERGVLQSILSFDTQKGNFNKRSWFFK